MIDINPSTSNPTLPLEGETCITQVVELFFYHVIEPIPSLVDPTLPLKSELHTTHVLHVILDSFVQREFHLFLLNPIQVMRLFLLIGVV